MNKWIWVVIVIILLGLGWFLLGSSGDDSGYDYKESEDVGDTTVNLEEAEDSAFEGVDTTDQILNEIDDSLNYLE